MLSEEPPPNSRIPDLNRFERKMLGMVIFGALGVGGIGLYSSYHAVSNAAAAWGFNPSWILPAGLDISIPVFSLGYLLLVRFDMALAWVRFVPWALTLATVYLNVVAAGDNRAAQVGHGALPLLWVVCSEIAAHVYRVLIGAATGRRMERVRRSRWLLAPFSTFFLWRRMVLWEVRRYPEALRLERERRMIRAAYRQEHGRRWRSKVTRQQLAALQLGELAPVQPKKAPAPTAPVAPTVVQRRRRKARIIRELAGPALTPAWGVTPGDSWRGPHAPVIYFVLVGDKVKIGYSCHLAARLKELALAMNDLALVLHGNRPYERQLHERFANYRLNASCDRLGTYEWFSIQGELAAFLAAHGIDVPGANNALTRASVAGDELATERQDELADELATEEPEAGDNNEEEAGDSTELAERPGGKRRTRRSREEWLELATPIYRQEFQKRRKQPTGEEFAEAIKLAGYGTISPSTAKNIRTAILDAQGKALTSR
jgi:hypothetical protein